jgi:hypothetical protein
MLPSQRSILGAVGPRIRGRKEDSQNEFIDSQEKLRNIPHTAQQIPHIKGVLSESDSVLCRSLEEG